MARSSYYFIAIGGGQALEKYFLPVFAKRKNLILSQVITKNSKTECLNRLKKSKYFSQFRKLDLEKIDYIQTGGNPTEIARLIKKNGKPHQVVLVLTPPQTHLIFLRALLSITKMKVYLEKPAVTNLKEYLALNRLIKRYHNRIYFTEQYAYGRAISFIKAFKKLQNQLGKIKEVHLHLEEGGNYFKEVQKWQPEVDDSGKKYFSITRSWFVDIGPELDLGVHLLSILFRIFPQSNYKICSAGPAKDFPPNYGFEAKFDLETGTSSFPVYIKCGKRPGPNRRFFKLVGSKGTIWQEFTSGTAKDPVYVRLNNKSREVAHYPLKRLYFDIQMTDLLMWIDKPHTQEFVLQALKCTLTIKSMRTHKQIADGGKNLRIVAMLPARLYDYEIKKKNIRHIAGKPLIYYAIRAAIDSGVFDKIFLNSESDLIGMIGKKLGVEFYKRDPNLAKDSVSNEEFVFDFLQKIKTEYLFMINPNKPLISPQEIKNFVKAMLKRDIDAMFSTELIYTQVFFKNRPMNFSLNKPHVRSKQIEPAQAIQWTITGWRAENFLKNYKEHGYAVYSGKIGLFPVSDDANFSVKKERDLYLVEKIMKLTSVRK